MVTNIVTKLQTHTTENDTSPAVFGRSKRKKNKKETKNKNIQDVLGEHNPPRPLRRRGEAP